MSNAHLYGALAAVMLPLLVIIAVLGWYLYGEAIRSERREEEEQKRAHRAALAVADQYGNASKRKNHLSVVPPVTKHKPCSTGMCAIVFGLAAGSR